MSDSDVVIRVEGLGKKYTIKHEQQVRHNTLRDAVAHQAAALGRWANPFTLAGQLSRARRPADYLHDRGEEDFWALKDVSFEIRRGERVGIIGRNGAGKSTLLKILSRITEPTTGRVEITGRVASLLEVGTGFHPELTGRENIYLNGAILGMTRREIRSKFDEIVDFAEVEKFLDTPVKRYSSGMYVRLAFAVAAHLEPEILVVDEVLAVGDASFQSKCLNTLKNTQNDNSLRTVLFVSHNLDHVRSFFERGIVLLDGRIKFDGEASSAIDGYRKSLQSREISEHRYQSSEIAAFPDSFIKSACIRSSDGEIVGMIYNSDAIILEIYLSMPEDRLSSVRNFEVGFGIVDQDGRFIFGCNNKHVVAEPIRLSGSSWKAEFRIGFFPVYRDEQLWVNLYAGWFDEKYVTIERAFAIRANTKISTDGTMAYERKYCNVDIPGLGFSIDSH